MKDGKFLMGKRKNAHGEGTWALPGGHLEFSESWAECAAREVLEETGMHVEKETFIAVTNDFFKSEDKHYITIYMRTDWKDGVPEILEPEKCDSWEWFTLDNLPSPLFLPFINIDKKILRSKL